MQQSVDAVASELVLASRILAAEGIIDSFDHVSVRYPRSDNLQPFAMDRAWEQWSRRVGQDFGLSDPAAE